METKKCLRMFLLKLSKEIGEVGRRLDPHKKDRAVMGLAKDYKELATLMNMNEDVEALQDIIADAINILFERVWGEFGIDFWRQRVKLTKGVKWSVLKKHFENDVKLLKEFQKTKGISMEKGEVAKYIKSLKKSEDISAVTNAINTFNEAFSKTKLADKKGIENFEKAVELLDDVFKIINDSLRESVFQKPKFLEVGIRRRFERGWVSESYLDLIKSMRSMIALQMRFYCGYIQTTDDNTLEFVENEILKLGNLEEKNPLEIAKIMKLKDASGGVHDFFGEDNVLFDKKNYKKELEIYSKGLHALYALDAMLQFMGFLFAKKVRILPGEKDKYNLLRKAELSFGGWRELIRRFGGDDAWKEISDGLEKLYKLFEKQESRMKAKVLESGKEYVGKFKLEKARKSLILMRDAIDTMDSAFRLVEEHLKP